MTLVHSAVVTYRRHEQLQHTLDELDAQTRPPDIVTVVDNDPSPELEQRVSTRPRTEYVGTQSNGGPAGGIAEAMRRHRATGADWLLLIDDDDPPPTARSLEDLVVFGAGQADDVGAVGQVGARFDRHRGLVERVPDDELDGPVDVDYISGGHLPLYRTSTIEAVGVFDADLYFGFEELEYGLRCRDAGLRLVVDGALLHELRRGAGRLGLGNRTTGSALPPWRRYYSSRNIIAITRRYGSRGAVARTGLRAGPGAAGRALAQHRRPDVAVAALHGTYHGLRGVSGRARTA